MSPVRPKALRAARGSDETVASEFGDRMRVARKSSDLTLREVSEATGISVTYLSDLERGTLANPTLDKLVLIARTLRMPLAQLVGADESCDEADEVPMALEELRRTSPFAEAVAAEAKRWQVARGVIEHDWIRLLRGISVLGRRPRGASDYLFIFEAVRRAIDEP